MSEKKTSGRKKIPMEPIEKDSNRLVTFSKRRDGLFKKASEISTLCGVQIVVIVMWLAGKPFSFGSPDIESVLNRFITRNDEQQNVDNPIAKTLWENKIRARNLELEKSKQQLSIEKKHKKVYEEYLDDFLKYAEGLDTDELKSIISKLDNVIGSDLP